MENVRMDEEYDLVDPGTQEVVARLRARDVFNHIVENAWRSADPGMIFSGRGAGQESDAGTWRNGCNKSVWRTASSSV